VCVLETADDAHFLETVVLVAVEQQAGLFGVQGNLNHLLAEFGDVVGIVDGLESAELDQRTLPLIHRGFVQPGQIEDIVNFHCLQYQCHRVQVFTQDVGFGLELKFGQVVVLTEQAEHYSTSDVSACPSSPLDERSLAAPDGLQLVESFFFD